MKYHIALSRQFDLDGIQRKAEMGLCPRHTMWILQQQLNAVVHQPDKTIVTRFDRLLARIIGQPEHWALARKLSSDLSSEDLVVCAGEDIGLPLAILCALRGIRAKLVVMIMAPDRPRPKILTKLLNWAKPIQLIMTNTQQKADFLQQHLQLADHEIFVYPEQTDAQFFNPGPMSADKQRPLIASAGLEQRDYRTLAAATQDLDLDVRACAVSPNASAATRVAFPEVMPSNMVAQHYDWPDLRQLYRDADIVVVSLLYNHYSAGLTVLMEAMACKRPVVITRTPGLASTLIDLGIVTGVEAEDPAGLKQAILHLLNHPEVAAAQAQQAYELFLEQFTSDGHVESIIAQLHGLEQRTALTPGDRPQPVGELPLMNGMNRLTQRLKPYLKRT
ncbi:glycosyltransferase family 4 protein [Egbenema bharatensis]|uniref:glycosyltransferase family 4 protein n=1 Tax=Egbenema bharatensis TaxID=3463334 RepID=UPI003A8BA707